MILLDTNVLSELMKPVVEPTVARWLEGRRDVIFVTTAICVGELRAGLARLPLGKRRLGLEAALDRGTNDRGGLRVLPFDDQAARRYGAIIEARLRAGLHPAPIDHMIAAVAAVHRATIATRNTADFFGCGVPVIDPWSMQPP